VGSTNALALGAVAGGTIFLGLPVARLHGVGRERLALLNALAVGVLCFLFVDVMGQAAEPVETADVGHNERFWPLLALLAFGFGLGFLGLVAYGQRLLAGGSSAWRLSLLIAGGIGLHNLAEGLAIGNAARTGALSLALTLGIGFALHNATEGFGIAAPLANEKVGWRFLAVAGLIGGGPTFLGTLLGGRFTSDEMSVFILALAGGSILFVVVELLAAGRRLAAPMWVGWGLTLGVLAGFVTDFVVARGGA
jgi:ZIP family zinc transporter